jgi:PAS domain-containing protein
MEMLDLALQDLSTDVVVATAFFHIHLPAAGTSCREVARLVLIFRCEGEVWMIVHCSYSIPYQSAQDGEVYPLKSLEEQNSALQALVAERTQALDESQALYRLLTEDTQDVLWRTDSQLIVTYISPADERLRGFRADEVVGHSVFEMFTDEGVELVRACSGAGRSRTRQAVPRFLRFQVDTAARTAA